MEEFTTFEQAYEQYELLIRRFVATHLRNAESIEDVCQEIWLKVWRAWARLRQESVKAWLYTIALNAIRDHIRQQKLAIVVGLDEDLARTLYGGQDELHVVELVTIAASALQELKPLSREALLLQAHGYSLKEIGVLLDQSSEGTKMLVCRARRLACKIRTKQEVA